MQGTLGPAGGKEQRLYRFPNGFDASLISNPKLERAPAWSVVALKFDAVELPGTTNGLVGDWQCSVEVLMIIKDRPHF